MLPEITEESAEVFSYRRVGNSQLLSGHWVDYTPVVEQDDAQESTLEEENEFINTPVIVRLLNVLRYCGIEKRKNQCGG